VCAWVGNQRSRGVVTARVRADAVRSLHHQRWDLHQSTYPVPLRRSGLILLSSGIRFWVFREVYLCVFWFVSCFHTEIHWKSQKNHIFHCPITPRAANFVSVTMLSLCPSWLSLVASYICVLSFSILLLALFVPLTDSNFPNNKPIQHLNRFAFASRLVWTLALPTLDSLWNSVWASPSIGSTFAITNNKFLPYPISISSHIPPFRTVTRRASVKRS
jgi:hypothetical protein